MALRDASGKALIRAEVSGVIGVSRADLLRHLDAAVPESVTRVSGAVDVAPRGQAACRSRRRAQRGPPGAWGTRASGAAQPVPCLARHHQRACPRGRGRRILGPRRIVRHTPASRQRTYWYASYRSDLGPAGIDVAEALELTRRRFAGKAAGIGRVLATATPEATLAQRIWTVPALGRYARDRQPCWWETPRTA